MGSEETIVHNTFGRLENKTLLATKIVILILIEAQAAVS